MKKIKLTQNKFALVDDEDLKKLLKNKWFAHVDKVGKFRAGRNIYDIESKRKQILMHREIMNPPQNMLVDHINHNTLDNRKKNLRVCKQSENMANSNISKRNKSGYKGVSWDKYNKKWLVVIKLNKKTKHIGRFYKKLEAAQAYNKMAIMVFGKFALLNKV